MLFAFGDDPDPLPETVRILDEITTDYIIETCHIAAHAAEYSGRTKLKVDDFKFAIRKDDAATGRVKELLATDKYINIQRKAADDGELKIGLERGGRKRKREVDGKEAESELGSKKGDGKVDNKVLRADEELGDDDDE